MSGMSVLKPHVITDAMLTNSTVIDIAPPVYAPATVYVAGMHASVAGVLGLITAYESLQAGNVGHPPGSSPAWWAVINTLYQAYSAAATYAAGERVQDNVKHLVYESISGGNIGQALTDALKWIEVSATGRWAPYDEVIGTISTGASPMVNVIKPGMATTGIALFELSARAGNVTVRDAPGGAVVFSRDLDLDGTIIEDVYDWFFADYEPLTDVVLTDLPGQYYNAEITVTLTSTGAAPSVGVIKPGTVTQIGDTKYGARVGIVDYTQDITDKFGNNRLIEGAYSKKGSFAVVIDARRFNKIYRTLASMRAIRCVYIGTSAAGFEPLLIYGRFQDFSIDVEYFSHYLCALEVKGSI